MAKSVFETRVAVLLIEKQNTVQKPDHVTKNSFNSINFKNPEINLSIVLGLSR